MRYGLVSFVCLSVMLGSSALAQTEPEPEFEHVYRPQDMFMTPPINPPSSARLPTGKPGPDYWQNEASYRIAATLDAENRTVSAKCTITFVNNSPIPLDHIWINLEQNLFNPESKGARMTQPGARFGNRGAFKGGYDISSVSLWTQAVRNAKGDLVDVSVFDGQPTEMKVHDTLGRIDPPTPVAAHGGVIEFEIDYSFNIPAYGSDRLGIYESKKGDVFQIAQWFPSMCVFDDIYGWNTMSYLGAGEFYTDFGTYDVTITAPRDHIVVATGALQNPEKVLSKTALEKYKDARASTTETVLIRSAEELGDPAAIPAGEGPLTWHFVADNVRTFAWASSAAFIWDGQMLEKSGPIVPMNRGSETTNRAGTFVQSAYPPEAEPLWHQSTHMLASSIDHYNRMWYTYPYPSAINVNGIVGGMEYPMIIFCSNRNSETGLFGVTTHEIGHNWFPMIVSTDERRHAWMDEGFNTFINYYSNREYFPDNRPGRGDARDYARNWRERDIHEPDLPPDFYSQGVLGRLAYAKPATGLVLLREQILGPERFDEAFREYINRWAFKHPRPGDFYRTMNDVAGEDLSWFWRGWFHTNSFMDHTITNVRERRGSWNVTIENKGDLPMPVVMDIHYSDGSVVRRELPVEIWASTRRWTTIAPGSETGKLVRIVLDPDEVFPDVDPSNNTWEAPANEPEDQPEAKSDGEDQQS